MSPNEQTLGSEHLNNEIQRVFMFWILALTFRTGLIGDLAEKKNTAGEAWVGSHQSRRCPHGQASPARLRMQKSHQKPEHSNASSRWDHESREFKHAVVNVVQIG